MCNIVHNCIKNILYLFASKKMVLASDTTLQREDNVLIYLVNLLLKHQSIKAAFIEHRP